jgi:hypothetical protein
LALAAAVCGLAGAYFGVTVLHLRGIERTWRTAMAIDDARVRADQRIRSELERVAEAQDPAGRGPISAIGTEEATRLMRLEEALDDRSIFDSKVSALRDSMIEALRFRRFQMSPDRLLLGSTPLQSVERDLDAQLDRWGLEPASVGRQQIRALAPGLAELRRFADIDTGATLFALDGGGALVTIDVDASKVRRRPLDERPMKVVALPDAGAVLDRRGVTLYPIDPDAAAITHLSGTELVAAGDGSGDVWVADHLDVHRVPTGGGPAADPGADLPVGRRLVGATASYLVLDDAESGRVELWSTEDHTTIVLTPGPGRFLAAIGDVVLWQGPLPFGPDEGSGFLHVLHVESGRRDLIALPRTDATAAAIARDGTIAIVAGPLAAPLGSIVLIAAGTTGLQGMPGPFSSVDPNSLSWSADGWLFWLTPEGRIAVRRPGVQGNAQLLRTNLSGLRALAAVPTVGG